MTNQEAKEILEERFKFALEHYKEECTEYAQALEKGAIALETVDKLQAELDQWKRDSISDKAKLGEYKILEEQGLLVKLPEIKLYKTLYWIWDKEVMPVKYMGINHGCVDEFKKYHVVCRMHTKKDKTFNHGMNQFTYKTGDERCFYAEDIGKTVFLTKKEAKKRLAELEGGIV